MDDDKKSFVIVKTSENSNHFKPILEKDLKDLKTFDKKEDAIKYVFDNFGENARKNYLVCSKAQYFLIKAQMEEEKNNLLQEKMKSFDLENEERLKLKIK